MYSDGRFSMFCVSDLRHNSHQRENSRLRVLSIRCQKKKSNRKIDLGMQVEPPTPQPPQPISLESDGWNTDVINGIPPRDLNVLFYVSVILPLIIAAAIFVLLSIIMLGNRQGLTQLSQFNTICRATANLRYMSQSREAAPILGGQSGFSTPAHSASRATTPKRSQTDLAVHATSSLPPRVPKRTLVRTTFLNQPPHQDAGSPITDIDNLLKGLLPGNTSHLPAGWNGLVPHYISNHHFDAHVFLAIVSLG
ncbi:hypothetical protein CAPTEDRAFT_215896 [Capitella teleta]|uniref:Uncharacterized protein n=1 Tax=Capitella teleta TaxID=283909 RepID=R7TZ11_CAPTE|nr:hypothetical protein CAPTEDRAFT_215896 [Capitella teleta]|eukprot:ELT99173.1 hypothetical protein CAPTEDRAFT_215896 [Capitella teleta]